MKKSGIKRANPKAIEFFDKEITKKIGPLIKSLKQNMDINARKTLIKQDVKEIFKKQDKEFDL